MHPILIPITKNFFIGTYGVMIALGLLVSVTLATMRGRRIGIDSAAVWDLATVLIVSGFAGARILYILQNFGEFLKDPAGMLFAREGFVFVGGLACAALSLYIYMRVRKIDKWLMSDLIAFGLPLGHAFGRIGCHFAGCCFGDVCKVPGIGIHVPPAVTAGGQQIPNAWLDQLERGLIDTHAAASLPVWPVQLFEATGLFAIAAGIAWWNWSKPRPTGVAFGIYLVAYSVLRFSLEFLRGDSVRGVYFGGAISFSQIVSLIAFVVGLLVVAARRNGPTPTFALLPEPAARTSAA